MALKLQPDIVHLKNSRSSTLFHLCSSVGETEALSLLLQINCEHINDRDKYGHTALILAARDGHSTSVDILIQHGADLNIKSHTYTTALMYAARNDYSHCVKILLQNNVDVNIKDKDRNTAYDLTKNDAIKTIIKKHSR